MTQGIAAQVHNRYVKTSLSMMDVLGHLIIWLLISVITLGIGLFFWPYAAAKLIINSVELEDGRRSSIGRLQCDFSFGSQIGHIILWILLSVVTLGLAYPFYLFGVARTVIDNTRIV